MKEEKKKIQIPIQHETEVVSTNSLLSVLCKEGNIPEFHTILADFQSAGKGQRGNFWESAPNQNLLFSIVLYPTALKANQQYVFSMMTSLCIVNTLNKYTDGFTVKWPNDIYWHHRKICGILIENEINGKYISQSIVGIGLNINQDEFLSDAPNPVSLKQILKTNIDTQEVLQNILQMLVSSYKMLEDNFEPFKEIIHRNFLAALYRREGFHTYRDAEGEFEAEITSVGMDGYLYLKDRSGKNRQYAFKEVEYILTKDL